MTLDRKAYQAAWYQRNKERLGVKGLAWQRANPEKTCAYTARWRERNPQKVLNAKLRAAYGISSEIFRALEIAQQGECLICGSKPAKGRLNVDHNHDTGKVRGLLCNTCNRGMGYLRDDPVLLRQAALYLEGA